jgi:hypothetical protein
MQWYAEHVAAAIAQQQTGPANLYEESARLHTRTAELQDAAAACLTESTEALLTNGHKLRAAARREWVHHAQERARQERERARALAARIENQKDLT